MCESSCEVTSRKGRRGSKVECRCEYCDSDPAAGEGCGVGRGRGRPSRGGCPILLAALVPLFVTSPETRWVEFVVGAGSWLVFAIDLVVQRRIVPDYLHRRQGKVDLGIVLVTFPPLPDPGVSGASAILLLARLARVVRLLLATAGLRRFAARLGKLVIIAGVVLVLASLGAYQAEHRRASCARCLRSRRW